MPPVRAPNPFSCLFLFFLTLFILSLIIIFLPIILLVLLFYAIFAGEKLRQANRKFRDSAFAHRYFHTRTAPREEKEEDPDVVDVGFTVVNEDDPGKSEQAR